MPKHEIKVMHNKIKENRGIFTLNQFPITFILVFCVILKKK